MKKFKLSDLFSPQNYISDKLSEQAKQNILNQTVYKKTSIFSRFKRYYVLPVSMIIVFVFVWFLYFNLDDPRSLDMPDTHDKSSVDDMWTRTFDMDEQDVQEEETEDVESLDFQQDEKVETQQQEQPEVSTFEMEESRISTEADSYAVPWMAKKEYPGYFPGKIIFADKWTFTTDRVLIFVWLVLINIAIIYFLIRKTSITSKLHLFLLILAFVADLFIFYWLVFIFF